MKKPLRVEKKKKTAGREEAASGTVHFLKEGRREKKKKTQFRFILMDERAEFIYFFLYLRKEKKQITCTSIH